jgi:hypothetical protein
LMLSIELIQLWKKLQRQEYHLKNMMCCYDLKKENEFIHNVF